MDWHVTCILTRGWLKLTFVDVTLAAPCCFEKDYDMWWSLTLITTGHSWHVSLTPVFSEIYCHNTLAFSPLLSKGSTEILTFFSATNSDFLSCILGVSQITTLKKWFWHVPWRASAQTSSQTFSYVFYKILAYSSLATAPPGNLRGSERTERAAFSGRTIEDCRMRAAHLSASPWPLPFLHPTRSKHSHTHTVPHTHVIACVCAWDSTAH